MTKMEFLNYDDFNKFQAMILARLSNIENTVQNIEKLLITQPTIIQVPETSNPLHFTQWSHANPPNYIITEGTTGVNRNLVASGASGVQGLPTNPPF